MINKAILVGNLGSDPEKKETQEDITVVTFSVATTDKWKDKTSGEAKEHTEWHNIVAFGRLGEICNEHLSKGILVYLEGKIQTREWEDKSGGKHVTKQIVAQEMKILSPKKEKKVNNSN